MKDYCWGTAERNKPLCLLFLPFILSSVLPISEPARKSAGKGEMWFAELQCKHIKARYRSMS
jgi:hypothetical protein